MGTLPVCALAFVRGGRPVRVALDLKPVWHIVSLSADLGQETGSSHMRNMCWVNESRVA